MLTAGVMIGLALIPGAALMGIGVASGSASLIDSGALRWTLDAAMVVALAAIVFAWKRARLYRRVSML